MLQNQQIDWKNQPIEYANQ